MTVKRKPQHYGMAAIILGVAAAGIYWLMINVTLARLEALSGNTPFDMRPFGYSLQEAVTLLDALGREGRQYYVARQIPLDIAYPALLAMTLIATIRWFDLPVHFRKYARIGTALALGVAVFDYAENLGIVLMTTGWPSVSEGLVFATSSASIVKSALTVAAVVTTLALAAIYLLQRRSARRQSRV